MCPTKPPIAVDVPKGLEEVKSSSSPHHQLNGNSTDLMDDTCPVCYADFKDKNEVANVSVQETNEDAGTSQRCARGKFLA